MAVEAGPETGPPRAESKYERVRKIGVGSYGVVFKCINRQTGQVVAIKRYSENDSDPIIRKIAMREVRMLRQLKHPNLIRLIEVFRRRRRLHLVFDYCELTVLDVIEKYANNCPLNLIKKIMWQIVNGISYCHDHNCIHRDVKPENILINQAGVVKLCDFGFARSINRLNKLDRNGPELTPGHQRRSTAPLAQEGGRESAVCAPEGSRQALTEYVATRWYRAPELLIGETYYDAKIDVWAIGCVAAELMRGEPIWPGKTDLDQLSQIQSSLGRLTSGQTGTLLAQAVYSQANIERLLGQSQSAAEALDRKLPGRVGRQALEFLAACLRMDPARRPASRELLRHPYIHSARMAQFVAGSSSGAPVGQLQQVQQVQSVQSVQPGAQQRANSQSLSLTIGEQAGRAQRPVAEQPARHAPKRPEEPARAPSAQLAADSRQAGPNGSPRQQQQQQQQQQARRKLAQPPDAGKRRAASLARNQPLGPAPQGLSSSSNSTLGSEPARPAPSVRPAPATERRSSSISFLPRLGPEQPGARAARKPAPEADSSRGRRTVLVPINRP